MKKILFWLLVMTLVAAQTYAATPIAQWKMNEGSGSTVADTFGLYNGAIAGNVVWFEDAPPVAGISHSLYFGGGYLDLGMSSDLSPSSMSLSFWAKSNGDHTGQALVSKYSTVPGCYEVIFGNDGALYWRVWDDGGNQYFVGNGSGSPFTVNDFQDGQWHNIVGTVDAVTKTAKLYVDGVLRDSAAITGNGAYQAMMNLMAGQRPYSGAEAAFYGFLSNIEIFNEAIVPNGPLTVDLHPSIDTRIYSSLPDYCEGWSEVIATYNDGSSSQRALVQFDLSSIPANNQIDSAQLILQNLPDSWADNPNGAAVNLYRLTQGWSIDYENWRGTTWNSYDWANPWSTPGGDYAPEVYAVNATAGHPVASAWNVTSLVDEWYRGIHANYGMILIADPGCSWAFWSSEMPGYKPVLRIQYTEAPMVETPTFSPDGGILTDTVSVTISCATPGATIRYTTNGDSPSETNGTVIASGSSVIVAPGTTLKAKAWADGMQSSIVKTATYQQPNYSRPYAIPYTSGITVDGNLADWADAAWAPVMLTYDSSPTDIKEAYYAAKWKSDKVYVAMKVRDDAHFFTSTYTNYDARDAAEFYIHTTGTASTTDYSADQAAAQQYIVGIMPGGASVWTGLGGAASTSGTGFVAAGGVDGEWLIYEAAITPYQTFNKSNPGLSVVSPLSAGDLIGLDATVVGHNLSAYTGMTSENLMYSKYMDYGAFGLHVLVTGSNIGSAKDGLDGTSVSCSGIVTAVFGDVFYIEAADRSNGIRVEKSGHGLAAGFSVLVKGVMATDGETGERYIDAQNGLVTGTQGDTLAPLGMNNKALGGAPAGDGLNNVGLYVRTVGRVGDKGDGWFTVTDGSGVSVTVLGQAPAGTPYVAVTGASSCEKDGSGNVQRRIIATSIEEVAP